MLPYVDMLTESLTLLSPALNPWMYSLLNRSFRKGLAYQGRKLRAKLKCEPENLESELHSLRGKMTSNAGSGSKGHVSVALVVLAQDFDMKAINNAYAWNKMPCSIDDTPQK